MPPITLKMRYQYNPDTDLLGKGVSELPVFFLVVAVMYRLSQDKYCFPTDTLP